jgi:hypothetical protein
MFAGTDQANYLDVMIPCSAPQGVRLVSCSTAYNA